MGFNLAFKGLNVVDICVYTGITTCSVTQETRPFLSNQDFLRRITCFFVTVVFIVLVFLYQNNVLDNTLHNYILIHYYHPE